LRDAHSLAKCELTWAAAPTSAAGAAAAAAAAGRGLAHAVLQLPDAVDHGHEFRRLVGRALAAGLVLRRVRHPRVIPAPVNKPLEMGGAVPGGRRTSCRTGPTPQRRRRKSPARGSRRSLACGSLAAPKARQGEGRAAGAGQGQEAGAGAGVNPRGSPRPSGRPRGRDRWARGRCGSGRRPSARSRGCCRGTTPRRRMLRCRSRARGRPPSSSPRRLGSAPGRTTG